MSFGSGRGPGPFLQQQIRNDHETYHDLYADRRYRLCPECL